MMLRTMTMALALSCGLLSAGEAKSNGIVHPVKAKKLKVPKNGRNSRMHTVRPRKVKPPRANRVKPAKRV